MVSDVFMDHVQSPQNRYRMEDATCIGIFGIPGQGPYVIFYLLCEQQNVFQATFESEGCGSTIACASWLTEKIAGLSIVECQLITPGIIIDALGGLPRGKEHSATRVITAFQNAIQNHWENNSMRTSTLENIAEDS